MRDSKGRFIKGYKPAWSEESRQKLSNFLKGKPTWNKGKTLTEEHKAKCRANGSMYWLGKKRPDMTGEKHPNYKKYKLSPLYRSIRESFRYETWRKDVLRRDGFICVLCGNNQKLEADHFPKRFIDLFNESNIKTFDEAMSCEKLWHLEIGRTLCKKCHLLTPTWGKRGN